MTALAYGKRLPLCSLWLALWLAALTGSVLAGVPIPSDLVVKGTINSATDTGSANTHAITLSPPVTVYKDGMPFSFKATNANTGSATLTVNGLSALTLKAVVGGALVNLSSGDIIVGQRVDCYRESTTCVVTSVLNGQDTAHTAATPRFAALGLGGAAGAANTLKLYGSSSGAITLQGAAAAGTYTLTLPTDDGAPGDVLTTDGSGVLSWGAGGSGGVPVTRTLEMIGTTNQVAISPTGTQALGSDRSWTFSLPQSIHTAATPQFNGLGLGVAAPSSGGQIAQTLGANNVTGTLMKRFTDASPTGNFVDYQTAAGASRYSVSVAGGLSTKTATIQPLVDGFAAQVNNAAGSFRWKIDTSTFTSGIGTLTSQVRQINDNTGGYFDQGGYYQFNYVNLAPTGFQPSVEIYAQGLGDNTTPKGVVGASINAADDPSVSGSTKGVLYALSLGVGPKIARNNVPNDDVNALTIANTAGGVFKATEAIYIATNAIFGATNSEWGSLISLRANADWGLQFQGNITTYGIDFIGQAGTATYSAGAVPMRLPNNLPVVARNQANSADVTLYKLDTNNRLALGAATEVNLNGGAVPTLLAGTLLNLADVDGSPTTLSLDSFGTSTRIVGRRANGTRASFSKLLAGNVIFNLLTNGAYDTTNYTTTTQATMRINALNDWSSTDHSTYFAFRTTAAGSTAEDEAARIAGGLSVGTTTDLGRGYVNALYGYAINNTALASTDLSDTANLLRVLSKSRPNQTINNSATNVDFTSIYTILANTITTGTHLRVELDFTYTMSGSTTTAAPYLKLGGTTVYTQSSVNLGNSATRHVSLILNLYGTAAPGASVAVEVSNVGTWTNSTNHNATATVTTIPTNGTLTIVPGITWGATGSADAMTLRNATVTQIH